MKGLAANVVQELENLESSTLGIDVQSWGYPELREHAFSLDGAHLVELIGPAVNTLRSYRRRQGKPGCQHELQDRASPGQSRTCRGAMGIAVSDGALRPAFRTRVVGRRDRSARSSALR